jgi:DNA adenine methylase
MARETTTLAPWFGSERMVADRYAAELNGCRLVGIPFGGGMSIVRLLTASTIHVNDMHPHIINLARVVANPDERRELLKMLKWTPFSEAMLRESQRDVCNIQGQTPAQARVRWAFNYFVCVWMARNGTAGTKSEFKAGLSARWDAGGGDSVVRWHSALRMLSTFGECLRKCHIWGGCFTQFIPKIKDNPNHGLYCDPPWDGPGKGYQHSFTRDDYLELERLLAAYEHARVVIRINDTPLIREVFDESRWGWTLLDGRDQHNQSKCEVMIQNVVKKNSQLF